VLAGAALHATKSVCKNATAQIGFEFSDDEFWKIATFFGALKLAAMRAFLFSGSELLHDRFFRRPNFRPF